MNGSSLKRPDGALAAIEFTLPLRTVSLTNSREHWATKARRAATERTMVNAYWLTIGGRPLRDGEIAGVHMKRLGPRKLDDDNLRGAMKSVRDELAACLGLDDRDPRIVWMYEQGKGKPGQYAVEVRVKVTTDRGML